MGNNSGLLIGLGSGLSNLAPQYQNYKEREARAAEEEKERMFREGLLNKQNEFQTAQMEQENQNALGRMGVENTNALAMEDKRQGNEVANMKLQKQQEIEKLKVAGEIDAGRDAANYQRDLGKIGAEADAQIRVDNNQIEKGVGKAARGKNDIENDRQAIEKQQQQYFNDAITTNPKKPQTFQFGKWYDNPDSGFFSDGSPGLTDEQMAEFNDQRSRVGKNPIKVDKDGGKWRVVEDTGQPEQSEPDTTVAQPEELKPVKAISGGSPKANTVAQKTIGSMLSKIMDEHEEVTEENIQATMAKNNMKRNEVIALIIKQYGQK